MTRNLSKDFSIFRTDEVGGEEKRENKGSGLFHRPSWGHRPRLLSDVSDTLFSRVGYPIAPKFTDRIVGGALL